MHIEYNFSNVIALWMLHLFPNCITTPLSLVRLLNYTWWCVSQCKIIGVRKVCSMSSLVTYKAHTFNTLLNYRQFVLLLICRKPTCGVIGCRCVCYLSYKYMEMVNMNINQINLEYHLACFPKSPNYRITVVSRERNFQHSQYWPTSWTHMRKWRSCVVTIAMVKVRY